MKGKLIQHDTSDLQIADNNFFEAVSSKHSMAFNESYTIVGEMFSAKKVYATYDLTILGDISVEELEVRGDLIVKGNIDVAGNLVCNGKLICAKEIHAKSIRVDDACFAMSIYADSIEATGGIVSQLIIETNSLECDDGVIFAGEGLIGEGTINANAIVVGDYCDYNGEIESRVIELRENEANGSIEGYNTREDRDKEDDVDEGVSRIDDIAFQSYIFNESLKFNLAKWSELEEELFVEEIKKIKEEMPELHNVCDVVDKIINISYKDEILDLSDYLYVIWAKRIFPKELIDYETLSPVFNEMLERAEERVNELKYRANNLEDFQNSLYVLSRYGDALSIPFDQCADSIFSSIGLRYSTVLHAWRDING